MGRPNLVVTLTLLLALSTVHSRNRCLVEDKEKNVCIYGEDGNDLIKELERYVNKELHTSYTYMHMAQYFSRADKAYHGFSSLFKKQSQQAAENADKLKEYINKRMMDFTFLPVEEPKITSYHNLSYAIHKVLDHEQKLNGEILKIHKKSDREPHLQYFIEENFLDQKVDIIRKMADLRTVLVRLLGNHVGEHVVDDRLSRGVWF